MPSSHVYSDLSQGFVRWRATDGTHSHHHRFHVGISNIDNVEDPGSPVDENTLIPLEDDVNSTARNFLAFMRRVILTGYTLDVIDFQPVSGGHPTGPPMPLLPYTLTSAAGAGSPVPEAEVTFTFRDVEGAPGRFVVFGGGPYYDPTVLPNLAPDWAGTSATAFAAYIRGIARTGGVVYPANLTNVVSHHGQRFSASLHIVSGLNNRLRRSYRVK